MKWILMHHYAIFLHCNPLNWPHTQPSLQRLKSQMLKTAEKNKWFVFIFHLSRHAHTAALGQTYPLKLQSVTQL